MEETAEQELACGDLRQVKGKKNGAKRKFVQSVLFSRGAKDEENVEGNNDKKDEDCCNSTKKRQKKATKGRKNQNSKAVSQPRTPKKVTVSGKEISNKNIDSTHSPVTTKSDFFMKISERRQQNRQQNEFSIVSQEGNDVSCLSPNSASDVKTPEVLKQQPVSKSDKQLRSSKAKKTNSGAKKSLWKRFPSVPVSDKQTMDSSPNVSLGAKLTAEGNSYSAEKPLYPIFLGRNANKRNKDITAMKEGHLFNPIHVFEADKNETSPLDWRDLMLSQGSFPDFNPGQVSASLASERSFNSLQFDDFTICYPSTSSTRPDKMSLDQHPSKLIEENERLHSLSKVLPSCQDSESDGIFNCFQQGNCNMPENSLWTDRYQPRKATELCGNGESVKFISEWLCLWHEKGSHTWSSFEDQNSVNNTEYSYSLSDADSENTDEETSLKNVLLVTGPVGSGKSAAIYACAKDQGFQIIEVNTSDLRTGALVKQRFGEALESHWLQHKADNMVNPETKSPVKSTPESTNLSNGSKSDFEGLMQLLDGDSQQAYQNSCRSIGRQNIDELKTLIFFEDVDATLSEDHGLFSTIKKLAQTAKRPMILSANKYNFVLPQNLDRLEVQFRMPPLKELNTLGYMVCAAENTQIDTCMIDHMVEHCQGDIRKTIMNLQFWCQSQNPSDGNKLKVEFGPFLFDLEAGHQLLPKLISCSCPSQLSEFIEDEMTKSLQMMEENDNLVLERVVEEKTKRRTRKGSLKKCSTRPDLIDTKKEEMLNLNCSLQVEDELLCQSQSTPQLPDISSSPVGFATRNIRGGRFGAVVFSDSDEDHFHDGTPFSGSRLDTNCGIQGLDSNSPPPSFAVESCCFPDEQLSPSDGYQLEQRSIKCSGTSVSPPQINFMYNVAEVSSVPESSAISEAETISQTGLFSPTVSYSPNVCMEDVDSMIYCQPPSLSPIEHEKLLNPVQNDTCTPCSYSDSDKATLHGELIGDSRIVHGEDIVKVSQELDECSRCAFVGTSKNFEKPRSHCQLNNVEETWKRLRCMDLKHHVTPEQKDVSHCLDLTLRMTDLISDADLLLSYCQPHLYDLLEFSASLHGKTHSYSWYDDQLQMSSTISQHGICSYAKEAGVLGSEGSCCNRVDLALEMLLSSSNTMSLGKLLTLDKGILKNKDLTTPTNSTSLKRWKDDSSLCEVIQSIVPKNAYMKLQGDSFHEYLSSLSQISRLETSESSSSRRDSQRKQRRRQTIEHYLSSGTYSMSPEDISLLNKCNSYRKEVN